MSSESTALGQSAEKRHQVNQGTHDQMESLLSVHKGERERSVTLQPEIFADEGASECCCSAVQHIYKCKQMMVKKKRHQVD